MGAASAERKIVRKDRPISDIGRGARSMPSVTASSELVWTIEA
jgi:hypothetical protein